MTELTQAPPNGTPTWVDLGIPDLNRAMDFYGALFGWEFEQGPPETGGYTMCLLRGQPVAAIMANPDPDATAFWWNVYFSTDDCEATAARVLAAGGQVPIPVDDAMDQGRMAIAVDPVGAQFALWEPRAHIGARIVNEPGSLVWNELVAPDPGPAREFYSTLFGYTLEPFPDMDYTVLNRPDGRAIGGIFGDTGAPAATWATYFEVEDTDAALKRVADNGGTVKAEAQDTPYGRIGEVLDPFGTWFYLMRSPENS